VLVVPGTAPLSEALWQQIAPLVTPLPPRRGRPHGDLRRQLEGMLAVMHTGAPWREVPPARGPWQTVYTRHRDWVKSGLWERIVALLHPEPPHDQSSAPP
jgi:transposase